PLEERKRLCDPPNLPNLISFICLFPINMQPLALFLRKEPGGLSSISPPSGEGGERDDQDEEISKIPDMHFFKAGDEVEFFIPSLVLQLYLWRKQSLSVMIKPRHGLMSPSPIRPSPDMNQRNNLLPKDFFQEPSHFRNRQGHRSPRLRLN